MVIWYILWSFGKLVVIWFIFPRFGTLCHEKSGNPVLCTVGSSAHDGENSFPQNEGKKLTSKETLSVSHVYLSNWQKLVQ
jgi:hypothetical protein